jgi:hypothetical protein
VSPAPSGRSDAGVQICRRERRRRRRGRRGRRRRRRRMAYSKQNEEDLFKAI